jgi:hypothetical protein
MIPSSAAAQPVIVPSKLELAVLDLPSDSDPELAASATEAEPACRFGVTWRPWPLSRARRGFKTRANDFIIFKRLEHSAEGFLTYLFSERMKF